MTKYNADAIEVLTGLEPVRKRPGMYTDTTRPNQYSGLPPYDYHHLRFTGRNAYVVTFIIVDPEDGSRAAFEQCKPVVCESGAIGDILH